MEAGILLKDVEVTLYDTHSPERYYARLKTKTDENGYFKFNGLEKSVYFVTCKKPGYATYSPAYRAFSNFGGAELRIKLNWGESRYLKIKMVKGGQLKVKVFKKDENGISPYTGFIAQIGLKEGDNTFGVERVASRYRTRNGDFYLDGLIPSNKYRIRIHACERIGYPIFKKEFEVKKNEITTIEHTFDFTDNTGITGMIYLDNVPVKRAILS
ncbi:MAG: carboxypeptidase regulatory-like domain-containing protein, partial [bacterium]|nr:carboxypeptidase regulatory-like domain-containing protein [bacterium]